MSTPMELPPLVKASNITKRFGSFTALEDVSLHWEPASFHALLGENGAGKSTLVKCIMGYHKADQGTITVGAQPVVMSNPRDAQTYGIGMVYQHFTLVPNMTVAENFLMARRSLPFVLDWKAERQRLEAFMDEMPFRVDPSATVRSLAAGQKQKVEILKQLYLDVRVLMLDEPTSVLTPAESDEILGLLHGMTREKKLSVLLITHKFKHVMQFADEVTVLRRGKFAGTGKVKDLNPAAMAEMMIGNRFVKQAAVRSEISQRVPRLRIENLCVNNELGKPALKNVSLALQSGEILGIAGVSGNGQRELVEVLAGQRPVASGAITLNGQPYRPTRQAMRSHKIFCLPEEPLKNACVGHMSVTENLALRNYDVPPHASGRWFLNGRAIRRTAQALIEQFNVRTPTPHTHIARLSGGNIQRAVLARELSNTVEVLIAANPVFGLDFSSVEAIHSQLIEARNRGTAVLLISEDLDELLELCDRIVVVFSGEIVHETPIAQADIAVIGAHMAGMPPPAHAAESNAVTEIVAAH